MKKYFENLLQKNLIPFMEIVHFENRIFIKVYFPKIITSTCKLLNKKFIIKNKKNLLIRRDEYGYHKVNLEIINKDKLLHVEIKSILKHTWGISEF